VQYLQSLKPLLWSCGLSIHEQVHLGVYLDDDSRKKLAFVPEAALDTKERARFEIWQAKIEWALRVNTLNGVKFTILEE
jgi:hypothetical protein